MTLDREISRRSFCSASIATLAALATTKLAWPANGPDEAKSSDLESFERARILTAANQHLKEPPITITSASSPRSAGGKHDYFSEGDYWWPDPKDPNGPYIQRDGMSNPDNFTAHRHALIRLGVQVPALTAGWIISRKRRYADHAAQHLRAWFLNPDTLMNPNLQYAQAIHGRTTGRGTGIIDTIHLVEVARSIPHLQESGTLSQAEENGIKDWFAKYLDWLTTSKNGHDERDAKNNHGTWWLAQAAAFADLTRNDEVANYCGERYKTVLIPNQVAADGSLPEELRRTKPYNYCLFNLAGYSTICQVLSNKGENLFAFALADGRGFAKTMAWMFPYIQNKASWPHPPDVEYFQYWPIRQPTELFAGLGLLHPEYVELWKKLPPEPDIEEIVRNNPIRQPLLWLKPQTRI